MESSSLRAGSSTPISPGPSLPGTSSRSSLPGTSSQSRSPDSLPHISSSPSSPPSNGEHRLLSPSSSVPSDSEYDSGAFSRTSSPAASPPPPPLSPPPTTSSPPEALVSPPLVLSILKGAPPPPPPPDPALVLACLHQAGRPSHLNTNNALQLSNNNNSSNNHNNNNLGTSKNILVQPTLRQMRAFPAAARRRYQRNPRLVPHNQQGHQQDPHAGEAYHGSVVELGRASDSNP